MIQIWKCRFCNLMDKRIDVIEVHEKKCLLNPENRLCLTCINYIHGSTHCKEGRIVNNINTAGVPCDKWVQNIEVQL